jgi:shikimate kinase
MTTIETKDQRINIYLIGFMGVGKSAVGRALAQELEYEFVDSDACIEDQQKCSISEIFKNKGETAFRQLERAFIEDGHPNRGCVVSCGGGLVIPDGMSDLVMSKGVVVCLFADEKTILERTSRTKKRPLLAVDDPMLKIKELLKERLPIYRSTGTGICTENRSIREVTAHILRVYEEDKTRYYSS